jgi:23S rRNA pseudouridine1911/1915/1917 synthase
MSASVLRVAVPVEAAGARLDAFLAAQEFALTRSAWKRQIEGGRVFVDGRVMDRPAFALKPGMAVTASVPADEPWALVPEAIPLEVVYEDAHLAVVVKPAGLVVHPGHGRRTGTLVHALLGRGMALAPAGGSARPGIVHRLDKDTSGLVIVAKTDAAHAALSGMFARREVKKTYRALVWGRPAPPSGTIDDTIGRSRRDPTRMAVRAPRARSATTIYRTLERLPGFSDLEIDLVTGRTHQIRVHFAARRHPVVGDSRYGGAPWRTMRDTAKRDAIAAFPRLALHAASIAFEHPVTGAGVRLAAPLPEAFAQLLAVLRRAS